MNRNVESHFSRVPSIDIQRSTFDRSHSLKTSFNVGELVPLYCQEVLPGDTVRITTSKVVRLQTLLTPILDSMYIELFWFYTPNRILWRHWKEFCGENNESAWLPSTTYTEPSIGSPEGGFAVGTIADYLGLPVNVEWDNSDELAPSALPFRGYAKIVNEWFRDQNLKDPLLIPDDDAYQVGTNGDNYITDVANGGRPFIAAKFHDRFTSCLPAPQKGAAVGIPIDIPLINGSFPVTTSATINPNLNAYPLLFQNGTLVSYNVADPSVPVTNPQGKYLYSGVTSSSGGNDLVRRNSNTTNSNPDGQYFASPMNLVANVSQDVSAGQVSFNVNELRLAFATQRYLEKLALGGSRYSETLSHLFSVNAPDASLQRPEYLGGSRTPLNVSEVTNNAQTEEEYLGDLGAMSVTADQHYSFTKSFVEHGYIYCLGCVRYKHSYNQGIPRQFMRKTFLDYYQPTFANLGNMPVYSAEIFADGNIADGKSKVFGYQEAWSEYRYAEDRVSGEMRPNIQNSLASWHLGDNYESTPYLSSTWIDEDKTNVDRVLAVTSQIANQVFGDFYFDAQWTRPMPMYSIPGLIDHF